MLLCDTLKKDPVFGINIIISQLNREVEKHTINKEYRAPVATDIFGADAVQQFADAIILLHRPDLYGLEEYNLGVLNGIPYKLETKNKIVAEVVKNREGRLGRLVFEHDLSINKIETFKL